MRTDWVAVGVVLLLAGVTLVLLSQGPTLDVFAALGAGLGVFGAAMILRSIRPHTPPDDDDPGGGFGL